MINQLIEYLRQYFFYHPETDRINSDESTSVHHDGIYDAEYYNSYLEF